MAETFLYLTSIGRVTGNPHKIEIWYVEHAGGYYLCSEYPDKSDWVKNIKKTPQVRFYVAERGEDVSEREGRAYLVTDEAELEAVKANFRTKYDWDNGLIVGVRDSNE